MEELRTFMEWEIAKTLKTVPGVIDVNVLGGEAKQYQVILDPKKLLSHNLTISKILNKLKESNLNAGGGYIEKGLEQVVIRTEGKFNTISEIANTAVYTEKDGTPLYLRQIADIQIGSGLRYGVCSMDGEGEVVCATVMMLMGRNSQEVVKHVSKKMEEIKQKLPSGMSIETFYNRSEFINRTLLTVFLNLSEAFLLVSVLLILLLGSWKGAILVALSIPVSMLLTTIFMNSLGIVGNLMSLGALDFGLLVDGSIVMLEAVLTSFIIKKQEIITRSKEETSTLTQEIIQDSCLQVASATLFSLIIIMLVYLPLMALEGVEGKMFRPMALTVFIALGMALIYSLVIFPALLRLFYKEPEFHESKFWIKLEEFYSILLKKFLSKEKIFLYLAILIFIFSILLSFQLGAEFLPKIDEGELAIDIKRLPSTSLTYSKELNTQIEKLLLSLPEVKGVVSRMGRGESAAEPIGSDEGEIMVKLKPKKEWKNKKTHEETMQHIKQTILNKVPSSYISLSQPIENRVNAILSGSKADVVIKIYGNDLKKIKEVAEEISEKVKVIKGASDIRVQRILGLSLLEIRPNRYEMSRFGVPMSEILNATQTLRVGAVAGKVIEDFKRFDLVVRLSGNFQNPNLIGDIPILTENGNTVPLDLVSEITLVEGPAAIYREGLKRRIFVEINVRGRDLVGFVTEAQRSIQTIIQALPSDMEVHWGGQFENFTRAKNKLLLVVPMAIGIIFGMLILAFGNIRYALGVFSVVPLAIMGGIWGLYLRSMPFSIPAGVGFIALSGIAVLNGVVYASALKQNFLRGMNPRNATFLAALQSLRAVVTTEAVALIGFLPMALSQSSGAEVQRPLATVVIFGILISTLFSRFLLPIILEKLLSK